MPPDDEPFPEQAETVLQRYRDGGLEIVVPDLFWAEFANVFGMPYAGTGAPEWLRIMRLPKSCGRTFISLAAHLPIKWLGA